MIILIHTSKTMRSPAPGSKPLRKPMLLDKTEALAAYLKKLSPTQLQKIMHISPALADRTHAVLADWTSAAARQSLAVDSFVGDIYSGLRASMLTPAQRDYADAHLRILSGLYGVLQPYDGVMPYRLEMGYRLPEAPYANLYTFWGRAVADCLPESGLIVNLASIEYSRTVTPFIDAVRMVAPKFLTKDPKTREPAFVVVHAKIARGAFARWLITSKTTAIGGLSEFADLGYRYDAALSTSAEPVFVCDAFGGKGLSIRLQT